MQTVLSVSNITKRFISTIALQDVSMSLYSNEILAVLGENGAGKSTLMKIISGSYPSSENEGEIMVGGKPCKFQTTSDSEAAGISMIYQELNLALDLSVAENIMLGSLPKTKLGFVDWGKTRRIAGEALERLGANIDLNVTTRSLSPSLQQLVCIARALVRKPKILILDEPTSVLTESETRNLINILFALRDNHISCIYISHKLSEVFEICDRLVVLRDGKYISTYNKSDVYDSEKVIEDMTGRSIDSMYPDIDKTIGDEVLRVENLRVPHAFAGKNIIEDVSFSLRAGEVIGLAGLVGSGRSEVVNAIFGAIPKTHGNIYIHNKPVTIREPLQAKRYGLGLLTEDRKKNGFVYSMTIKHNMTLTILNAIRSLLLLNDKKEEAAAKEYFDILKIKAPGLNTLINFLSGGNQQKVILAKWLMTDLKIIFLDEPTRGIDVGTKHQIYKLIGELSQKGIAIVMISSELPELLGICDRFVILKNGVVTAEITKEEADEVRIMQLASGT